MQVLCARAVKNVSDCHGSIPRRAYTRYGLSTERVCCTHIWTREAHRVFGVSATLGKIQMFTSLTRPLRQCRARVLNQTFDPPPLIKLQSAEGLTYVNSIKRPTVWRTWRCSSPRVQASVQLSRVACKGRAATTCLLHHRGSQHIHAMNDVPNAVLFSMPNAGRRAVHVSAFASHVTAGCSCRWQAMPRRMHTAQR